MPYAQLDNGKKIHYNIYLPTDPGEGKTILFVHGLGSTQNFFVPVLPYLRNHRCIILDNYGAGRSKLLPGVEPKTSLEEIGQDALGVLDSLGYSEAVVVGFSMGGMVPTSLAADPSAGRRVIAGVCIGPVHPGPDVAKVFQQRIDDVGKIGMDAMANLIPWSATGQAATETQKAFIREMLLAQEPAGYIANCRAIQEAKPPRYEDVRCPMLIIGGDEDKSAPVDNCKRIYAGLGSSKNRQIEILKGIGHWYCVEDGDQVGKLIKTFVESLE